MNLIKEICAYYKLDMPGQLSFTAQSLYMALLYIANEVYSPEITPSNTVLMGRTGIKDVKTLERARQELLEMNLISYKSNAKRRLAGKYAVLGLEGQLVENFRIKSDEIPIKSGQNPDEIPITPPHIQEENRKEDIILFPEEIEPSKPQDDKKTVDVESFFKECWNLYPLKRGQISKTQKEKLFKLGDELKRCISRYLKDVDLRRGKGFKELQYKNGSSFFNNGYKDYLDEVCVADKQDLPDYSNLPIKYVDQESSPAPEKEVGDVDF